MQVLRSALALAILALLLGGSVTGGAAWWYHEVSRPPAHPLAAPVTITVSPGMNPRQIGGILRTAGVIRSAFLFRLLVGFYGVAHRLQPGSFQFTGRETPEEAIAALLVGKAETVRVTVPEGLTQAEIALILEANQVVPAASFTAAINDRALLSAVFHDWGEVPNGEGLAFPETYQFNRDSRAEEVARTMLEFTRLVVDRVASGSLPQGLTRYQACVLASVVEREARRDAERPLVASVFLNRLSRGMRLESCATVQYALPEQKDRLTYDDLKVESPFNTYLRAGLPPTPIANFGKASLAAVASPSVSDFLYFVSDDAGGHRFSRTLAEHERSRRQFFRDRRQRKLHETRKPR
ncbi:MAG: endolytic transglycosylase MltG [Candidatus Riflebacteria bacterium]|nr:endolytic transglycosylase MltG [Candidatus Riflebacteria bacterium]